MLRGDWRFFLAIVAIVALAGVIWVRYYPSPPRLPTYQSSELPKTGYRPGGSKCEPARLAALKGVDSASQRDSCADAEEQYRLQTQDLIQQTRAADAAREGVFFSYQQTILGLLGALIGIVTLGSAIVAAHYARKAFKTAKESADIENRPFLYLSKVTHEEREIAERTLSLRFCFHIFNSGKLPAYNLAVKTSAIVGDILADLEPDYDAPILIPNCPPGVARMVFAHAVIEEEYYGMFQAGFAAVHLSVSFTFDSRTVKNKTITEERRATRDGIDQGLYYLVQPKNDEPSFDFMPPPNEEGERTADDDNSHPAEG